VPDHLADFPTDRPVYVVCRSGARSANACGFLRASGVDAINVTGGTLAWIEAGFDVVAEGEPG
jgi:rhodanese-related sulfurtransferase